MKITTLQDRIERAEATIEKKNNTITKKLGTIQKKAEKLSKMGINTDDLDELIENRFEHKDNNEAYWLICDIMWLKDDIKRGKSEIEEKKNTLENYRAQLNGELERESIYLKELPECVHKMKDELVERWDSYDKKRRDFYNKEYQNLGYYDFMHKYHMAGYTFRQLTDSQIHDSNERDAKLLVMNLYIRVKEITGEITSWNEIYATVGACGCTTLNGYVEGKEGRARVESIEAGGYNIQRLHIRVLVKECK